MSAPFSQNRTTQLTNEEFIIKNREQDIRSLALRKMPEGVDALWCMRQIEGYQLAKKKLPMWAATEGLHYPPRISMEQCSSESTALYKQQVVACLSNNASFTLTDLTGGFGVDFSYMAKAAKEAYYVEQQEVLCNASRHNMPMLGLPDANVVNKNSIDYIKTLKSKADLSQTVCSKEAERLSFIFLDPARRDDVGRKTVAIEDCTPNVIELQDQLLTIADYVIVKLSPMLDITQALRSLRNVTEVHVVSVKGECKELLFVISNKPTPQATNPQATNPQAPNTQSPINHCVNLDTCEKPFVSLKQNEAISCEMPSQGKWLFEPNASILKAGVQDSFAQHYNLRKLHPQSNLFIGDNPVENIPARSFRIELVSDFSKQSLKALQSNIKKANLTIRNFPSTVAELRKRLKLKEGGDIYLFATTILDNTHKLLVCKKEYVDIVRVI